MDLTEMVLLLASLLATIVLLGISHNTELITNLLSVSGIFNQASRCALRDDCIANRPDRYSAQECVPVFMPHGERGQ